MIRQLLRNKLWAERRQTPRKKTRNLILISIPGEAKLSNLVDLSESGAQFSSSMPLPVHHRVALKINLAETNCQIEVIGKVVWVQAAANLVGFYRVGVTFVEAGLEACHGLHDYMNFEKKAA